jgi:hypothetical protein
MILLGRGAPASVTLTLQLPTTHPAPMAAMNQKALKLAMRNDSREAMINRSSN